MLNIVSLKGMSDWVSVWLALQKQESDTMLDTTHSLTLGEYCPMNLEILELLSSVMKMTILKYCP